MEHSTMSLFPWFQNAMERFKILIQADIAFSKISAQAVNNAYRLIKPFADSGTSNLLAANQKFILNALERFNTEREADIEFINLFTHEPAAQHWDTEYTKDNILLDLPGMRLIDISTGGPHQIENYSLVVAPRAGHHSNIAEKTALFMRDKGLTRMAIVEQKCASDIPLVINGKQHREDFEGEVRQFKTILQYLKNKTGFPPHLIAVCQPGPLLMTTLILNPGLGKTYGSAGSPMHTEAERGLLTDFSRLMGEGYIDNLIDMFSNTVPAGEIGEGRKIYDGRLQVLGFYYLGMDQHMKNFRKYYSDLKASNIEAAERQKEFYQWYNWTHHLPAEFIQDTFKKIFVNNELIHGRLKIGEKTVGIRDYPGNVPIWALGGSKDDIVPPFQATGHLDLIDTVPAEDKLSVIADAGHMGIFRSSRILNKYYGKIVKFILSHSDKAPDQLNRKIQ